MSEVFVMEPSINDSVRPLADPMLDPWLLPAWVLMDAEANINFYID
ncbi:MAG: hypothetical protein ACYCW6_05655 [Candidatus Xenobia bacterium]